LREAAAKGVTNVARYYYHETIKLNGLIDDIRDNIRRGLDVSKAADYRPTRFEGSPTISTADSRSTSTGGRKRSSSRTGVAPSASKRTCSSSPSKSAKSLDLPNRIHRRIIVRDYGTAIYKAKSSVSMLSTLESCVEGYKSLHMKAGLLQGDISTGNLISNGEEENSAWSAFLIDLDFAIKEQREGPSAS
jgi:hypothetical protein